MTVATRLPPPPTATAAGGGGHGWVELTRARHDIDAHLLTGRLTESGIETARVKDRSAPGAWLYGGSNPWAPVAILVRAGQLEDARLVLAEISWEAPPLIRPTKASEAPGPRWVTWWVAAIALGLLFTAIALARTAEAFRSCGLPLVCEDAAP